MQSSTKSDPSGPDSNPTTTATPQDIKQKRTKTTRPLPTARVKFDKQIRCVLSYGFLSDGGSKAVQIDDVGKAAELNASTVSLCNPFFVDVGFLTKSGRGSFTPSNEVLEMVRAHEWGSVAAPEKLAPLLRHSWAGTCLGPRLRMGPIDVDEAITMLADEVRAGPAHRAELTMVLDYLRISGVIQREGNQVSWARQSQSAEIGDRPASSVQEVQEPDASEPHTETSTQVPSNAPGGLGGVSFTVAIQVNAQEIARWSPERITAFFGGLAQVLAAQREGSQNDQGL